jgi:hypothetical protein
LAFSSVSLVWRGDLVFLRLHSCVGVGSSSYHLGQRWVMIGFIHAFGVIAFCIVIFGLFKNDLRPILGGISYLVCAYGALLRHKKTHSKANTDA